MNKRCLSKICEDVFEAQYAASKKIAKPLWVVVLAFRGGGLLGWIMLL
jgi:hypothetical protein